MLSESALVHSKVILRFVYLVGFLLALCSTWTLSVSYTNCSHGNSMLDDHRSRCRAVCMLYSLYFHDYYDNTQAWLLVKG
jgi:hypothetical protein